MCSIHKKADSLSCELLYLLNYLPCSQRLLLYRLLLEAPFHCAMPIHTNGVKSKLIKEPLKYSGSLDNYKFFESTPIIGREYHDLQLTDLLKASNREVLIRDLAVTISRRGVCFFRNQDITAEGQKELISLIGELAGKPKTSKLHIHPQSMFPDSADINDKGDRDEGSE